MKVSKITEAQALLAGLRRRLKDSFDFVPKSIIQGNISGVSNVLMIFGISTDYLDCEDALKRKNGLKPDFETVEESIWGEQ